MADRKITDLTALAAGSQATGDLVTIVDVSESAAADKNKKMTVENLFKGIPGDVGIGTSAPGRQLTLSHASQAEIGLLSGADTSGGLIYQNASEQKLLVANRESDGHIAFQTGGANERMRIDSSGQVGIGTSSPTNVRLDIKQSVSSTAGTGHLGFSGGSTPLWVWRLSDSAADLYLDRYSGGWITTPPLTIERDTGKVGIGTSSPDSNSLLTVNGVINLPDDVAIAWGGGTNRSSWSGNKASGFLRAYTNGSERMRIDSSGRLLIATSSSRADFNNGTQTAQIQLEGNAADTSNFALVRNSANSGTASLIFGKSRGSADGAVTVVNSGDTLGSIDFEGADGTDLVRAALIRCEVDGTPGANDMPGRLVFSTTADGASSATEHMRVDQGGTVSIHRQGATQQLRLGSLDGSTFASNENYMIMYGGSGSDYVLTRACNTADGTPGFEIVIDGTRRIEIEADGDIYNVNGTYGTISDARLKENIVDASSQWDDIKDLQVRNFNFTVDSGLPTNTQIGFVAQEVEQVSPGLVRTNPDEDKDGNDLGTTTKTVKTSVLLIKAVKALQEAMDRIETLETKVAALEAQ